MKVVQTRVTVGEDRTVRVRLPDDVPTGDVDLLVVIDSREPVDEERRRAAVRAMTGSLAHLGLSVEEFLRERREDDERRDKALGL